MAMSKLADSRSFLKEKLDDCFVRKDDPNPEKRFAPRGVTREIFEEDRLVHLFGLLGGESTVAAQNHSFDPTRIAQVIRGSGALQYCNVLAILLYSRCSDKGLRKFSDSILQTELHRPISDSDLPLTQDDAVEAFGHDDGRQFWVDQYVFCPVVLKENHESIYVDQKAPCPLPFVQEPEVIGKGAYAIVKKVIIEKGHLINEQTKSVNERYGYAQKEYFGYDKQARIKFTEELAIINSFIQSPKSHKNILTTKASLEWGDSYSLFFDLALEDLWHYFTDTDIETKIESAEQKADVFRRTIGLAGALAYLHEELLLAPTNEQLQCYHLDLKPQNILVFEVEGNHIWKISDFGISKIKRVRKDQPEHTIEHILDRVFRPKKDIDLSSGVENARFGGTYAAPEAKEESEMVTRKSDIWSLGCVLVLVLTFLERQAHGIHEFQRAREENREHDWFFDSEALKNRSDDSRILHPSVTRWLDQLSEEASSRPEGKAIQMASNMLQDKLLIRDEARRLSAKVLENELVMIHSYFKETPSKFQGSNTATPPTHNSRIPHLSLFSHIRQKHPTKPWFESPFQVSKTVKRCEFSPDGAHLAMLSNTEIAIKSIADIQSTRRVIAHKAEAPNEKSWKTFSLGSKYICVSIESNYFECSFIPLSVANRSKVSHIETRVKSIIREIALSPDDETVAFLLEDDRQKKRCSRVAVYRTTDMLRQHISSTTTEPDHTRSDESSVSYAFGAAEDLPWKTAIREPQQFELPSTEGLTQFKFCHNGKVLIAVTKPYRKEGCQSIWYSILSWDTIEGRLLSHIESENEGSDDLGDSWKIISLTGFANQRSFVTISRKRTHLGTYDPPEYENFSQFMGDELLDVLVGDEDEDNVILLGKTDWRGNINAFKIPMNKLKDLENLGHGTPTGLGDYVPSRDACCIQEKSDGSVLLVASMDTKHQRGKLCQISLDVRSQTLGR